MIGYATNDIAAVFLETAHEASIASVENRYCSNSLPVDEAIRDSLELAGLEDGWDGEDAKGIEFRRIEILNKFIVWFSRAIPANIVIEKVVVAPSENGDLFAEVLLKGQNKIVIIKLPIGEDMPVFLETKRY
jgi:hypothetical protein